MSSRNSSGSRPAACAISSAKLPEREHVEVVGDGAEPADADVRIRGSVLGADVGHVVRQIRQAEIELEAQGYLAFPSNVEAIGWNAERCSHAVGLPRPSTTAL